MLTRPEYRRLEVLPRREDKEVAFLPMSRKGTWRQYYNYNRQFKRYLMSQVGGSWDRVYSDVSRNYPKFKIQLKWTVSQNPIDEKTDEDGFPIEGFYVWGGKLCYKQNEKYKRSKKASTIVKGHYKHKGIWYKVETAKWATEKVYECLVDPKDVFFGRISYNVACTIYGNSVVCVSKRQISGEETRKLGLR